MSAPKAGEERWCNACARTVLSSYEDSRLAKHEQGDAGCPFTPAPSPEPQGSEGQGSTQKIAKGIVTAWDDSDGPYSDLEDSIAAALNEERSLLAVAEAKIKEWERECDKHAAECAEALRVAEERMAKAEKDAAFWKAMNEPCENGHHTHAECSEKCWCWGQGVSRIEQAEERADSAEEKLADSERKREEAVGWIRESSKCIRSGFVKCYNLCDGECDWLTDHGYERLAAEPNGEKP